MACSKTDLLFISLAVRVPSLGEAARRVHEERRTHRVQTAVAEGLTAPGAQVVPAAEACPVPVALSCQQVHRAAAVLQRLKVPAAQVC